MQQKILRKLHEIEKTENVRILLAIESGSRAWGFASTDSDYDVRFIYVRPQEEYLRLDPVRDVIELPLDPVFDINGWDLQKALRLMYKSNPTLFEWLASPIVYMETDFADKLRNRRNDYFSVKHSLYHYLSMATGNYREFLQKDMVKAKKYFYVLRPILACRWILEKQTPPPMLFSELAKAELPDKMKAEVEELLSLKMNAPEIRKIPRIDSINEYLEQSMVEIKEEAQKLKETKVTTWDMLNEMFLEEVRLQECEACSNLINYK